MTHRLTTISAAALAVLLTGCAEEAPPPPPPPPPPPAFADFAGDWQTTSTLVGVDDPVTSGVGSNDAGTAWVMRLEGREPVNLAPALHGDSLILTSDKYASILRDNVMVQLRLAMVRTDEGIAGKLVAVYDTPDGQEVVTGTTSGVRVP
jgi:hypothetical protein